MKMPSQINPKYQTDDDFQPNSDSPSTLNRKTIQKSMSAKGNMLLKNLGVTMTNQQEMEPSFTIE
jgi:hypothetical protein